MLDSQFNQSEFISKHVSECLASPLDAWDHHTRALPITYNLQNDYLNLQDQSSGKIPLNLSASLDDNKTKSGENEFMRLYKSQQQNKCIPTYDINMHSQEGQLVSMSRQNMNNQINNKIEEDFYCEEPCDEEKNDLHLKVKQCIASSTCISGPSRQTHSSQAAYQLNSTTLENSNPTTDANKSRQEAAFYFFPSQTTSNEADQHINCKLPYLTLTANNISHQNVVRDLQSAINFSPDKKRNQFLIQKNNSLKTILKKDRSYKSMSRSSSYFNNNSPENNAEIETPILIQKPQNKVSFNHMREVLSYQESVEEKLTKSQYDDVLFIDDFEPDKAYCEEQTNRQCPHKPCHSRNTSSKSLLNTKLFPDLILNSNSECSPLLHSGINNQPNLITQNFSTLHSNTNSYINNQSPILMPESLTISEQELTSKYHQHHQHLPFNQNPQQSNQKNEQIPSSAFKLNFKNKYEQKSIADESKLKQIMNRIRIAHPDEIIIYKLNQKC